jgi:hypothetical protein
LATVKDTPLKISVGPYDFASELTVMSDMSFQLYNLNAPYYTRKGVCPPFLDEYLTGLPTRASFQN